MDTLSGMGVEVRGQLAGMRTLLFSGVLGTELRVRVFRLCVRCLHLPSHLAEPH